MLTFLKGPWTFHSFKYNICLLIQKEASKIGTLPYSFGTTQLLQTPTLPARTTIPTPKLNSCKPCGVVTTLMLSAYIEGNSFMNLSSSTHFRTHTHTHTHKTIACCCSCSTPISEQDFRHCVVKYATALTEKFDSFPCGRWVAGCDSTHAVMKCPFLSFFLSFRVPLKQASHHHHHNQHILGHQV